MELKQSDRDALRANQQKINPKVIGNIVEHKTQDPKRYKELSRKDEANSESILQNDINLSPNNKIEIKYKVKFFNSEPKKQLNCEEDVKEKLSIINGDLPISLDDVQANSWLNMDRIEYEKLQWMAQKYRNLNREKEQFSSTTKFDKEGRVVQNITTKKSTKPDISKVDSDYEEENNDQVYDINELVNLLSSTYQRHTTYALIVIRKIANLANCGFYDGSFDENIHNILIKSCLLIVRSHMDSPDITTCLNAVKCLKSLLCNTEIDEINLDRIHPVICDNIDTNIWLQNQQKDNTEFTEEMKDQECVEIDPILALVERTNLIQRILYLFNNIRVPHYDYHDCILNILIRLARHSRKVCSIINNKGVLFVVAELFLPSKVTSETDNIRGLSCKALKLVRIIAQALVESKVIGDEIKFNPFPHKLIEAIQAYFFIDYYNLPLNHKKSLVVLYIESLRTVKILSKMKEYSSSMFNLMALGQSNLYNSSRSLTSLISTTEIESTISMEWQFAAHIIDLMGHYSQKNIQKEESLLFIDTLLEKFIKPALLKWINELITEKYIPHLDVSITIATAFKHLNNYQEDVELDQLIIHNTRFRVNDDFFKLLLREASNRSSLSQFSKVSGNLRDPDLLRSYGTINFNTTNEQKFIICPLLDNNSPFLLLNLIITKLHESPVAYNLHFINDISLFRYIESSTLYYSLDTTYEYQVRQSSIAQYEVKLIANLLLLVIKYYLDFTQEIDSPDAETKTDQELDEPWDFELARHNCYSNLVYNTLGLIGLLNSVDSDAANVKDKLFQNIVFNPKLQYRLAKENYKNKSLRNIPKLWQNFYSDKFLENGQLKLCKLGEKQYQTLFPLYKTLIQYNRYWIFQPIIMYYSNQISWDKKDSKTKDDRWFNNNLVWKNQTAQIDYCNDAKLISVVLQFHFTTLYCPSYTFLAVKPKVEEYLCLIGCLFLHDDVFLDEDLNISIKDNIRKILNDCLYMSESQFNTPFKDASQKIASLNNLPLADFFNKLIDQYESVSYGNVTFANFLVLFIATGSDLVFRKKLFQERMETCLTVLKFGTQDLWCPKELFFKSKESDREMKVILKRSIPYIPKGSFLSEYVQFHTQ